MNLELIDDQCRELTIKYGNPSNNGAMLSDLNKLKNDVIKEVLNSFGTILKAHEEHVLKQIPCSPEEGEELAFKAWLKQVHASNPDLPNEEDSYWKTMFIAGYTPVEVGQNL